MFGSSNRTIIQKQTLKTTQKWVTEHKTKPLLWPFQFPDLRPVRWTEEKKQQHGTGNLKGLEIEILNEGMVSDLLSGVL